MSEHTSTAIVPSGHNEPAAPLCDGSTETACAKSADGAHCDHWYDDSAPCCDCADDGGRVHGDHHPSLDCRTCSDRIADGRTTLAQLYELESVRINRHAGIYSAWTADALPLTYPTINRSKS